MIGDLGLGLGSRLGRRIGDWEFGIGIGIEIGEADWRLGIEDWDLGLDIGIGD